MSNRLRGTKRNRANPGALPAPVSGKPGIGFRRGGRGVAFRTEQGQGLDWPSLEDSEDRAVGIVAGLAWTALAQRVVVYEDFGISKGMRLGIARAERHGVPVEMRRIL